MTTIVRKADGTEEVFKSEKLRRSLRHAGATKEEVRKIALRIEEEIQDGMSTGEIYRRAFALLNKEEATPVAARYSLRRALFGLGPTGFPFEDFLARLYQALGYTTKTGIDIKGACVSHEIDLAAYKADHSFIAEAKFHARPGIKSDLQVALYCYARFLDLKNNKICRQDICGIKEYKVITNTKFTTTAERYASCVGLSLLSWNYPRGNTLHTLIERSHLYPITTLSTLPKSIKNQLLLQKCIICRDILESPALLDQFGLPAKKIDAVLSEARQLCQH